MNSVYKFLNDLLEFKYSLIAIVLLTFLLVYTPIGVDILVFSGEGNYATIFLPFLAFLFAIFVWFTTRLLSYNSSWNASENDLSDNGKSIPRLLGFVSFLPILVGILSLYKEYESINLPVPILVIVLSILEFFFLQYLVLNWKRCSFFKKLLFLLPSIISIIIYFIFLSYMADENTEHIKFLDITMLFSYLLQHIYLIFVIKRNKIFGIINLPIINIKLFGIDLTKKLNILNRENGYIFIVFNILFILYLFVFTLIFHSHDIILSLGPLPWLICIRL